MCVCVPLAQTRLQSNFEHGRIKFALRTSGPPTMSKYFICAHDRINIYMIRIYKYMRLSYSLAERNERCPRDDRPERVFRISTFDGRTNQVGELFEILSGMCYHVE